jgi:hypothetical protein
LLIVTTWFYRSSANNQQSTISNQSHAKKHNPLHLKPLLTGVSQVTNGWKTRRPPPAPHFCNVAGTNTPADPKTRRLRANLNISTFIIMKKLVLLPILLLVGLACTELNAQSCCIPTPACQAICKPGKAEAKGVAVATANTATATSVAQAPAGASVKLVSQPAAAAQPTVKGAAKAADCDPSDCDPTQCDWTKCDWSKCLPGSGAKPKIKA